MTIQTPDEVTGDALERVSRMSGPVPPGAGGRHRTGRSRSGRLVRRVLIGLVAVVMLAGVAAGGAWWWYLVRAHNDVPAGKPVTLVVPNGAGTSRIAELLVRDGVVRNGNAFRLRVRDRSVGSQLKAGEYRLSTGMDPDDVIARLVAGPVPTYVTVTIPEGFTIRKIAKRLEEKAGIRASEFETLARSGASDFDGRSWLAGNPTASLEGYLFPKTYRIEEGATARDVIDMMLDQFDRETAALRAEKSGRYELHELVTVASLIEREARLAKERPLVSSVIANRLGRNMRLELCASVEYLLPENRPRLLSSDLRIDSPYNTYRHKGLPPGPIASPGLAALEAAAKPARTPYLYYVLTGEDGSHTFTSSYQAFLKAKARSREVMP